MLGPRNRLPPRHPLFGPLRQLPDPPCRSHLRDCPFAKLDMWALRESGRLLGEFGECGCGFWEVLYGVFGCHGCWYVFITSFLLWTWTVLSLAWKYELTEVLDVALPALLAHCELIRVPAMAMSIIGGLLIYGTIISFTMFFQEEQEF